jgi:hypothetical protein
VTAQIFWLKTRARWRETRVELRHSGAVATRHLSQLTDEQLMAVIGTVSADLGFSPMKLIDQAAPDQADATRHQPSGWS